MAIPNPTSVPEALTQIRSLFKSKFQAPIDLEQAENDLKVMLENPLFKQYIFSNNAAFIIDHATFTYRYISDNVEDVIHVSKRDLMEKGMGKSLELMHPEDMIAITPIFTKATEAILTIPPRERLYVHFCYTMRYNTSKGIKRIYQQTIPITLNDSGLPYLALALISDISQYAKHDGVNYRLSLNLPGKPVRVILSGSVNDTESPLSEREKEVVKHLADGLDANEIAEKMFISEGTVRTHRKNVLEKTGAKNSVHLVRMAIANGWV